MTTTLRIARALALPCNLFARLAGFMLLILTGVIMYDVIGRRFFNTGSFVVTDLQWHLHGSIAILAFGYAYIRDAHVRIDIFAHKMSRGLKLWLEFWAILLFVIPFMLLLMWFGLSISPIVRSCAMRRSVGGMGLPDRWIIKSAIPLSALLTMLGALSVALRIQVALRHPKLLSSPFEENA